MITSNDPLTTLTDSVNNSNIVALTPTVTPPAPVDTPDEEDAYKDKDKSISLSREVWRPYDCIHPREGQHVIVRTRNHSYFHAVCVDGQLITRRHHVDIPVAEPHKWIPLPYGDLACYLQLDLNKDIPLEIAFTWLLREKHQLEQKVLKKAITGPYAEKAVKELQASFQRAETNNTKLITVNTRLTDENHELQNLIAQRNDELTKADSDLEECYAEIADLKHQLSLPTLSRDESLELSRLRMQAQLDAKDKTKLTGRVSNLENTIRQLRENAIHREEELGCRIESLQAQVLSDTARKEYEDRIAELETKYNHEVISHSASFSELEAENKRLTTANTNLTYTINQLRENNATLKSQIKDYKSKVMELQTHSVIPQVSTDSAQYLVKYNMLSTRFTKVVHLFEQVLKSVNKNKNKPAYLTHVVADTQKALYNIKTSKDTFTPQFSDIEQPCSAPSVTPVQTSPSTPVQSSTSALPTSPAEAPRPRIIHIPRVNFLKIPHVGNATLTLIEPLLNRFHVFLD